MGASYLKFISEHYTRKDFDHFNSVVNAGFIFNVALITPILLLALLLKDSIYSVFNLPVGIYDSLDLLFFGILLIVFITASTASYAAVLKATQHLKLASQIGGLAILLKTVSIVHLLNAGLDLKGLLFSEFIFVLFLNISSILYAKRLVPRMRINILLFRWQDLRSMLGYGIRLQVSQISVLVHQQTDKPLLAYLSGLESVSFYRIAQQMANLLRLATSFVLPVVVPAAPELSSRSDREGLKKLSTQGLAARGESRG